MTGEIFRPEDLDQILFLGDHTIRLTEFRRTYPHQNSSNYTNIIYGDPGFMGIMKNEKYLLSVDDKRIHWNSIVNINGKRTLIVTAELNSADSNKSLVDVLMADKDMQIERIKTDYKMTSDENAMYHKFVVEHKLAETWKEWLMDQLELLRVAGYKITGKTQEVTPVTMEIGQPQDKK